MTVSKTKAKLVDVARQLFAKMGVENTTMNDIALASKKGRRTLYTYFKSKEDIYMAVVESELDILSDIMKRVVEKDISPDQKIIERYRVKALSDLTQNRYIEITDKKYLQYFQKECGIEK